MDDQPWGPVAGGRLGRETLELLGAAAALGIPPSTLLRADAVELDVLVAAVREAHAYLERRDENFARRIVNEYAEAQKRGR